MKKQRRKIIIIGGGPAGLTAAIAAALNGADVVVLEKMFRSGLKLLASGGGRCNISNILSEAEFMKAFGRFGRFMNDALQHFYRNELFEFFAEDGVQFHCVDNFHYFPESGRALDILDSLIKKCRKLNVKILCERQVKEIKKKENGFVAVCQSGEAFAAEKLILTTGGKGYMPLGGGEDGYKLAVSLGHSVKQLLPGMVGLKTLEKWPKECSGIAFEKVELFIDLKRYKKNILRDTVLFTFDGVSGPAVIDLSAEVATLLNSYPTVPLVLNFFPELAKDELVKKFKKKLAENPKKHVQNVVSEFLPKAVAAAACEAVNLSENCKAAHLPRTVFEGIIDFFTCAKLNITATCGFEKAMVTRGGISLKEIDPKTLQSRVCQNLYFAGEVVDLDGPCGGYNLQWAFSSGYWAGLAAAVK